MAGFPYQYLIKEAKHHPAIIRMKMRMHFDNLIQWSSFFLTYIPIPAIHSIAITFQGIKMGISYFGIVTNQCEKLLKVLYFAICICCFRIINIDQQYIYQIAQSIIKWSEFRDQTDSTGTRSRIIAVQTVEIIIKRHINRCSCFQLIFQSLRQQRIIK